MEQLLQSLSNAQNTSNVSSEEDPAESWEQTHNSKLIFIIHKRTKGSFGITFLDSSEEISVKDSMRIIDSLRTIDPYKNIDIIIHTSGGDLAQTEVIIKVLLKHKGKIRIYIPYRAASAGTLISLCANEIYLGLGAYLTPVDPQLGGISTLNVMKYVDSDFSPQTSWISDLITFLKSNSQQSINRVTRICENILIQREYNKIETDKLIREFLISVEYQHNQTFMFDDLCSDLKNVHDGCPAAIYEIFKLNR